jgi:hypothetical protein
MHRRWKAVQMALVQGLRGLIERFEPGAAATQGRRGT